MLSIFNNNQQFCDAKIKPLVLLLIITGAVVLGWGIYHHKETMGAEDLSEDLKQQFNEKASIQTNFLTAQDTLKAPLQKSVQTTNKQKNYEIAAITKATPKGSVKLIANNSTFNLQNAIKRTIASVRPSVVNIKATQKGVNNAFAPRSGNQQVGFTDPNAMIAAANLDNVYENVGSGIIVSPEGHVLTNYHVIANANRILVSVYGTGRQNYVARVIDHHVDTDLTLLKIEGETEFKSADLGNSDIIGVGDLVLAIGNPFGLEQSVTSGIVSGIRKTLVINGVTYRNMIQTDAPINRGSSGGPLTNLNGEVIGVNTAIYAPTGVFNGTGFAMPIDQIKIFLVGNNVVPAGNFAQVSFLKSYSNGRGWLGTEVQPVDRTIALHLGLPYIGGVLINRVIENSPAWEEGLERGDVILEFDGRKITDLNRMENLIADLKPAETVKLLVCRDKKMKEFFITLSGMPAN